VALAIVCVALPMFLPPLRFRRKALDALIAAGVVNGFFRLPLNDLFIQYPQSRQRLMPFALHEHPPPGFDQFSADDLSNLGGRD
jgi:hypothetical protein